MEITSLPESRLVIIEDQSVFRLFCPQSLLLSEIHSNSKIEAIRYAKAIAKHWPSVDRISPSCNPDEIFITLCPTQDCNMSCEYCYVHSENSRWPCVPIRQNVITPEFVDTVIRSLVKENHKKIGINFIGGEPLLFKSRFISIVEFLRQVESDLGISVRIGLTTNGTFLNYDFLKWAKEQQIEIMLSLDSPPESHDRYRALNDQTASFANILTKIKGFEKDLQVVTTVTRQTPSIQEALRILLDHGFKKVGFNLVHTTHPELAVTREIILHFKNEFSCQKQWFRDHSSKLINLKQIHTLLSDRKVKQKPCLSGRGTLAIAPDGKRYFCHGAIGNDFYEVDDDGIPKKSELRKMIEISANLRTCKSCWARNLCGGDCWLIRWNYGDEIHLLRCDFIRAFITLAILTFNPKEHEQSNNSY